MFFMSFISRLQRMVICCSAPLRWLILATFSGLAVAHATGEWAVATKECLRDIPSAFQRHARFGCPALVDDSTDTNVVDLSPWTHPPLCVNTTDNATTTFSRKFCVFTNSEHGIGGVSLVITPEAAANSLPLLDERFASRQSGSSDIGADPPYSIVKIPGKGMGVIARRKIKRLEVFMVDYAALVLDMELPVSVRRHLGYELLAAATDQLGDPRRVRSLDKSNKEAEDEVEAVLRTNAFHAPLAGLPHMALYPEISRLNHACRPNSLVQFKPRSLAASVAATRDIEPGEELTQSYIPVGQTFEARQNALKKWEFTCHCSLCSASEDERAVSDARRIKIEELREGVVRSFEEGNAKKAVRQTEEALELMQQEDLFQMYAEQYENLGRIYWASGDRKTGRKFAKISLDIVQEMGYGKFGDEQLETLLQTFEG